MAESFARTGVIRAFAPEAELDAPGGRIACTSLPLPASRLLLPAPAPGSRWAAPRPCAAAGHPRHPLMPLGDVPLAVYGCPIQLASRSPRPHVAGTVGRGCSTRGSEARVEARPHAWERGSRKRERGAGASAGSAEAGSLRASSKGWSGPEARERGSRKTGAGAGSGSGAPGQPEPGAGAGSGGAGSGRQKKAAVSRQRPRQILPAVTYSPTQLPTQYHRR